MFMNFIRRMILNRHRAIFRYWDGSRMRSIDPMIPYRILDSHETFDWETHPLLIDPDDDSPKPDIKLSVEAMEITADAVRTAFEIPKYDNGRGLTEGELIDVLTVFTVWMTALKKNIRPLPISPEPTEPESSEVESITNANSLCGSTSIE